MYQFKYIIFSEDVKRPKNNPKGSTQNNSIWTKESLQDSGSLTYLQALALNPLDPLDAIPVMTPASSPQQSKVSPRAVKLEKSVVSFLQFDNEDWKSYFPTEDNSAQTTLVIYVIL